MTFTFDIWTDENFYLFLALRAHWIAKGDQPGALKIKAGLIWFHHFPGSHTGENITETLLHLLDHAVVTHKVCIHHFCPYPPNLLITSEQIGHITMDSVSNKNTGMQELFSLLAEHGIKFDPVDKCIMCFLHILNICSGYIAYQYTDADFSAIGAAWVDALDPTIAIDKTAYIAALWQDPVAIGHDIVCLMHASSLHHESFDNIVVTRKKSNWFISDDHKLMKLWVLELLRDVKLHWDSIYLMINLLQCFSFPMSSSLFP